MKQEEIMAIVESGEDTASSLLAAVMPTASRRFHRAARAMDELLAEIREHFPDASYYSASGTLHLMLGSSHDNNERPQNDLVAHSAVRPAIEGGDW